MKLGLGTVQFGLDYGISNAGGKTPPDEVTRILDVAMQHKVRIIDTAALYGTSEQALGAGLPVSHAFDIVTKTPQFATKKITTDMVSRLEEVFNQSLRNLNSNSIYGLLVHNADHLLAEGGQLLLEKMQELKQQKLLRKFGVSVYTTRQIDSILKKFNIDLIQLPVNVLDQRLLASGHLKALKSAGVEIHARSAFLQGLLLMHPDDLPEYFKSIKEHMKRYHEKMRVLGMSPVQSALGFVMGLNEVDAVICGVNDHVQFQELCRNAIPVDHGLFAEWAVADESIVNPSKWKVSGTA